MRAIGYYLIIEEIKEDIKETKGGLLLAEKHREDIRYRKGIIKSLGDQITALKEGDVVWFDKVAGHGIEINPGEVQKVILERDVIIVE